MFQMTIENTIIKKTPEVYLSMSEIFGCTLVVVWRRLSLAIAQYGEPKIILLDEPTQEWIHFQEECMELIRN